VRPVSAAFLAALRGSQGMRAEARLVTSWQTGVDPDGVELPIHAGDVRADADAAVRATLNLTTTAAWSTPGLDPDGAEVFVRRAVVGAGGTTEWVSLGYYRLYDIEQDDAPKGRLRLAGRDRMSGIVDARLLMPTQFAAGVTVGSVVEQLVTDVYPDAVIEWDDPAVEAELLTRSHVVEEDRHPFLAELVTSRAKDWYWDHRGVLVIRTPPDTRTPVWEVNAGAGGVLVNQRRRKSREGVYNAVVATGEGADTETPVRAAVIDDNPASRTYWSGRHGKVPRFFTSSFLRTDNQCLNAATNILRKQLGLAYSVDFTAVPNPALEPLDPVKTSTSDGYELHVLQTPVIPLTPEEPMTSGTREQRLVRIGRV
jgi:hypothetical protein